MDIKVYEIKGMDRCSVSTTYLGVKVNLEFKGGDMMSMKNGFLSTSNPFVQSAIEAMPSFGQRIVLKRVIKNEPAPKVQERVEEAPSRPTRAKVKALAPKKTEGDIVESVKNINDAVSYFGEKGITVESPEHLKELMEKHNVVFPNLSE